MTQTRRTAPGAALVWLLAGAAVAPAANFTTGTDAVPRFGVHEVVLTGNGSVANPFDTVATVRFTPPSGAANARTVWAFYDGGNTWRARVYAGEVGAWAWASACDTDPGLAGRSGTFECVPSKLRGRMLAHPKNPRQWATEDGRWFLNVVDTAYFLLGSKDESGQPIPEADFHAYVRDAVGRGITTFFAYTVPGPGSGAEEGHWARDYFADVAFSRLCLDNFRFSDGRLRWLLDHYPDAGVELILFPRGVGHGRDEQFWKRLGAEQKERLLRNVVARYAAYPQLLWLVANDAHYGEKFPNNNAYAREVGAFLRRHDPWQHPRSTGHARRVAFAFGGDDWATFLHLEHAYDLGAAQCAAYRRLAKPVLLGEDRYEQCHPGNLDPLDMRYYQRRLYWAWLLSGGSAAYGGRWWVLHPYDQTAARETPNPDPRYNNFVHRTRLTGLDSVRHIRDYFEARGVELSDFEPDPALARDADAATDAGSPKLMRRGQDEFLVYHPNAAADGREARANPASAARVALDLRPAPGTFVAEWYRADDGVARDGGTVAGGRMAELVAPWPGHDVVLRLSRPRPK